MEQVLPTQLVRYLEDRFPGCYSALDGLRLGKSWPGSSEVSNMLAEQYRVDVATASYFAPALCACAVWNCYRRIYAFQEPLANTLCGGEAVPPLTFPVDPLQYLPLPGIYVQAPNSICAGIHGFFAWICDSPSGDSVLQLLFLNSDGLGFTPGSISLQPGVSLCDSLPPAEEHLYPLLFAASKGEEGALRVILQQLPIHSPFPNVIHNLTVRAAQLLLYLVSADPDIEQEYDSSETVHVGRKISASLQKGASRRSHIRQGHWHKYWYGPKNGERHLIPKWIPPVIVGSSPQIHAPVSIQNID